MGYSPWGHKEADTTERLNNGIYIHIFPLNIYVSLCISACM